MTDDAPVTDVPAETPTDAPADPPAADAPSATPPSQPQLTGHQQFLEMLPEDLRTDPTFEPYKGDTIEDVIGKLAKSHVSVNKLIGADKNAILKFPTSDDDTEAYDAIYNRLGRPEEVSGYEIEALAKDNPLADVDQLNALTEIAHQGGVSKDTWNKIVSTFYDQSSADKETLDQKMQERQEEYTAAMEKEWGDAYDTKAARLQSELKERAADGFFDLAKDMPWLFDHPAFVKTIDNFIQANSEDGAPKSAGVSGNAPMTPAEAQAAINQMDSDPAKMAIFRDQSHPQRADLLKQRQKLFDYAYPG